MHARAHTHLLLQRWRQRPRCWYLPRLSRHYKTQASNRFKTSHKSFCTIVAAAQGPIEIRSHARTQRRRKKPAAPPNSASKVPLKKVVRATDKQRARDRDHRALQLAMANACAEAQRIADERSGWVRAAADLQSLLRLRQVVCCWVGGGWWRL